MMGMLPCTRVLQVIDFSRQNPFYFCSIFVFKDTFASKMHFIHACHFFPPKQDQLRHYSFGLFILHGSEERTPCSDLEVSLETAKYYSLSLRARHAFSFSEKVPLATFLLAVFALRSINSFTQRLLQCEF